MAFDHDYFVRVGGGGKQGMNLWMYYDQNNDNLGSVGTTINTTYFQRAYDDHGVTAQKGDLILVTRRGEAAGTSAFASCIGLHVPTAWDSNGASFYAAFGSGMESA